MAVQMFMSPASAKAIVMPIVALELCTTMVHIVPTAIAPSTERIGRKPPVLGVQSNFEKNAMNPGSFATALSSVPIIVIPRNSRPNPRMVFHVPRIMARCASIKPATPTMIAGNARSSSFRDTI